MTRDDLVEKYSIFLEQSIQARNYLYLIRMISNLKKEYYEEFQKSSAFFSYTQNAYVVTVFMELSKIYDRNKQSENIMDLLKCSKENIDYFYNDRDFIKKENESFVRYTVSPKYYHFFSEEIAQQREIHKILGYDNNPIQIEITLERYFQFVEDQYDHLKLAVKNLLKQRNKIYAHNEVATLKNSEYELLELYPVFVKDVENLIEFAFEFSRRGYSLLTGVWKVGYPVNIGDLEGLLRLVRIGSEFKQQYLDDIEEKGDYLFEGK